MPRRPQTETAKLSVRILRGKDFYWKVIRALDARGPWTINDVHNETNARHRADVIAFVRRLLRGEYAALIGSRPVARTGTPEKLYRLLKKPVDAPSLRRDGTLLPIPAQQRMWNAMRSLTQFSVAELAHVSGLDGVPVPLITAESYCHRLADAEYLVAIVPGRPCHPALYRLRRARNTGPIAPRVLRAHIVFDVNRNTVMGGDNVEAEAVQ